MNEIQLEVCENCKNMKIVGEIEEIELSICINCSDFLFNGNSPSMVRKGFLTAEGELTDAGYEKFERILAKFGLTKSNTTDIVEEFEDPIFN